MNDPIDAFELQLRRLKPAAPAPVVRERISAVLSTGPVSIPARRPAWRQLLETWIGPSPSLAWKFSAAAVAIAIACAAIFVSRLELSPAVPAATVSSDTRLDGPSQGPTAAGSNYQLASAASESQAMLDEGLVRDESGALARRVRMQFIDTLEYRDPKTGEQVVVSYPREELFSAQVRAF